MEKISDVVVIGGGPAGLACAAALVAQNIQVVVVERSDYSQWKPGEHLTPDAVRLLSEANLPCNSRSHFMCDGVRSAWGTSDIEFRDYFFHPFNYGLNLTRPLFEKDLSLHAEQLGVRIHSNSRLVAVERKTNEWEVVLRKPSQDETIKAKFLVDASGKGAFFARSQGIKRIKADRQIALVAVIDDRNLINTETMAYILLESSEFGWWYMARLRNQRAICMYVTDYDLLSEGSYAAKRTWHDQYRTTLHVQALFKQSFCVDSFYAVPSYTQRLNSAVGKSWIAIGDAAMTIDPLSSDGIARGIRSGLMASSLIQQLLDGFRNDLSLYNLRVGVEYEKYAKARIAYYAIEQRWPHSPFWKRRASLNELSYRA